MERRQLQLLAIAMTRGMNGRLLRAWMEADAPTADFFDLPGEELRSLLRITGRHPLAQADRHAALEAARREADFIQQHGIQVYFACDDDYPARLAELTDAPAVLFALGNGTLHMNKVVSVVGTRRPTPSGAATCRDLVRHWCGQIPDLTVVSGLAYGIDAIAHATALECKSPTLAVVAHGLDRVYPAQHRDLAREIVSNGGLMISEYPSGTQPYQRRFLERNRIIAGLCDATVVVESGYRGGALSTANVAFNANREVFAVPGRIGDEMSLGCNKLIARNKAHILTCADDLADEMRWNTASADRVVQPSLFDTLSGPQQTIAGVLKKSVQPMTVDMISEHCDLDIRVVMTTLTDMEFDGLVVKYPGNRYASN